MSLPEPPPHHPCLPGGLCPRGAPGPRAHLVAPVAHAEPRRQRVVPWPSSAQLDAAITPTHQPTHNNTPRWPRASCSVGARELWSRSLHAHARALLWRALPFPHALSAAAPLVAIPLCCHPVPPALCSAIPYREPPRPLAALLPCLRVGRGASGRCPALCCPCPSLRLATRLLANIATLRLRAQPSSALPCVSEPGGPPPPGAMQERATLSKRRSISGAQRVKVLFQKA
jgi:hypothetical protein